MLRSSSYSLRCHGDKRMTEDGSMAQLCTYARIDTVEVPFAGDLMDCWEDPTSFFLMNGAARCPSGVYLRHSLFPSSTSP